ncbi:MAG TPA: NAD(P)/FAD-dependent oxidoreductase [Gammaproteobacteria bacterium]
MPKRYDLVIVGTGTAARTVASRVRAAGRSVAVIDHRPFGGTCALRGCDPKKVLVGATAAVDDARRLAGQGVDGEVHIAWRALIARKRRFTDPVPERQLERFREQGVATFAGAARFTGRTEIAVGDEAFEGGHIVIAAGAEPVALGIPGAEHMLTSDAFLELDALPSRIVMVGGGYIAAEFSHVAARAGARVTILQRGERMLTTFDEDLVGWLMTRFEGLGIDVRTGATVERIDRTDRGFRVHATRRGEAFAVEGDLVVHAAGRAPALDALDLTSAGVAVSHGRLELNDYLQSISNANVYAAGDAAQKGPPLTPVASYDGDVVATNLLEGNRCKAEYLAVPSVAFTIPPIAAVGLDERSAKGAGLRFRVSCRNASDWYTARQAGEPTYGFKILIEERTDRILGAHVVGPHADEVINVFALAIRHGVTADELKRTCFAYPTGASDIPAML